MSRAVSVGGKGFRTATGPEKAGEKFKLQELTPFNAGTKKCKVKWRCVSVAGAMLAALANMDSMLHSVTNASDVILPMRAKFLIILILLGVFNTPVIAQNEASDYKVLADSQPVEPKAEGELSIELDEIEVDASKNV